MYSACIIHFTILSVQCFLGWSVSCLVVCLLWLQDAIDSSFGKNGIHYSLRYSVHYREPYMLHYMVLSSAHCSVHYSVH